MLQKLLQNKKKCFCTLLMTSGISEKSLTHNINKEWVEELKDFYHNPNKATDKITSLTFYTEGFDRLFTKINSREKLLGLTDITSFPFPEQNPLNQNVLYFKIPKGVSIKLYEISDSLLTYSQYKHLPQGIKLLGYDTGAEIKFITYLSDNELRSQQSVSKISINYYSLKKIIQKSCSECYYGNIQPDINSIYLWVTPEGGFFDIKIFKGEL